MSGPRRRSAGVGELSIELVVCLLVLVVARRWFGPPSRALLSVIGIFWTVLVVGHYADVTAPALYGREVNLYPACDMCPPWPECSPAPHRVGWCRRHRPCRGGAGRAVQSAALGARPRRRRDVERSRAPRRRGPRRCRRGALRGSTRQQRRTSFLPTGIFNARHEHLCAAGPPVWNAHAAATGSHPLPPSPAMQGDLTRLGGADVLLFVHRILRSRDLRATGIRRPARPRPCTTGRRYSRNPSGGGLRLRESPTFGEALRGLPTSVCCLAWRFAIPDTNALLMTQKRNTLVTTFARHGYRTIGIMPGMWQSWPEGSFTDR